MSTRKKKTTEQAPLESIIVRLKPVFGIKPRIYVPVIWGIIIITLVFLFLILPGIRQNGTFLTVESLPSDASVIIDGIRFGATGEEIFVTKGSRKLTVQRTGFEPDHRIIEVRGRIFASRLLPRKDKLTVFLHPIEGFDHMAYGAVEFAAWTATGPERERYAIPPVLTLTARDVLQGGYESGRDLPAAVLPLAIDERHLADILRAQFMLKSAGAPPGAGTITAFLNDFGLSASAQPDQYTAALEIVNKDRLNAVGLQNIANEDSARTALLISEAKGIYADAVSSHTFPINLYGNSSFVSIPEITAPIGDMEVVAGGYHPRSGALPVKVAVGVFLISTREVTNEEFAAFTTLNPDWSLENRDELVAEALADEGYLSTWSISGPAPGSGRDPVTEVSWYAAVAYAEWFTDRFLKATGRRARLPYEDEWEVAARLNGIPENTAELPSGMKAADSANPGTLGIRGMAGNVREWAQNPYRFNENRFRPDDGSSSYQSPDDSLASPGRPVRGGSYIDKNLAYPAAVRGGLPAFRTSPVVGFRLVIESVE